MKNKKISGHHTSKKIKNQILKEIKKYLNIQEKIILFIFKNYALKVYRVGYISCFNWENATTTQIQKNARRHNIINKGDFKLSNINTSKELLEAMEKARQAQKKLTH